MNRLRLFTKSLSGLFAPRGWGRGVRFAVLLLGVGVAFPGINEWTYVGLAPEQISDVVIHPQDPQVVFAAALDIWWDSTREGGVFRTTDGGVTWDTLGLRHRWVNDIAVDALNPSTIWAACGLSGVLRSTDGGDTWEDMSGDLPIGGPNEYFVTTVEIAPHAPEIVLVSAQGGIGPGWTYKSVNGGETWYNVHPSLAIKQAFFDSLVIGRVYAPSSNWEGVWISDNWGDSFRRTEGIVAIADIAPNPFQANGIWVLQRSSFIYTPDTGATWTETDTIFPPATDDGNLLVASRSVRNELFAATFGNVHRTTNGGNSWEALLTSLPSGQTEVLSLVRDMPPELWLNTSLGGIYAYTVLDSLSTSDERMLQSTRLTIFPNPAQEFIILHGLPPGTTGITLYNLLGQQLKSHSLSEQQRSLPILLDRYLPNGTYYGIVETRVQARAAFSFTIMK